MFLIHVYSGQVGGAGLQDPTKDPNYVATSVGTTGTGNFTYCLFVPFELDPDTGYCSLPSMNTAASMTLAITLGTSAQFYSVAPGTLPLIQVDVYQEFWAVPISDPALAPPDDGSSHQWTQSQGQVGIASGANNRVQLPDVGSYITSLIILMRDSTNARTDQPFNTDLELWVDGVPVKIESPNLAFARMYRLFGYTRPTGVLVYSFRHSTGLFVSEDNLEQLLATTPGTLVELFSGAWGTITNSPATAFTYTGKLFPIGAVAEHGF